MTEIDDALIERFETRLREAGAVGWENQISIRKLNPAWIHERAIRRIASQTRTAERVVQGLPVILSGPNGYCLAREDTDGRHEDVMAWVKREQEQATDRQAIAVSMEGAALRLRRIKN